MICVTQSILLCVHRHIISIKVFFFLFHFLFSFSFSLLDPMQNIHQQHIYTHTHTQTKYAQKKTAYFLVIPSPSPVRINLRKILYFVCEKLRLKRDLENVNATNRQYKLANCCTKRLVSFQSFGKSYFMCRCLSLCKTRIEHFTQSQCHLFNQVLHKLVCLCYTHTYRFDFNLNNNNKKKKKHQF